MYPQLQLSKQDYKAIAYERARRYPYKSNKKYLLLIGLLGLYMAITPMLLVPDNYNYTFTQNVAYIIVCILFMGLYLAKYVAIYKLRNKILAKWGIKDKKGKRWASE